MSTVVFAALAAGAGVGLLITLAGLTGRQLFGEVSNDLASACLRTVARSPAVAALVALLVFAATGWVVGAVPRRVVGMGATAFWAGKAARQEAIERTEAIASWTEMIRDSIVAASGLEEAIVATAPVAPRPDSSGGAGAGESASITNACPTPSSPSETTSSTRAATSSSQRW